MSVDCWAGGHRRALAGAAPKTPVGENEPPINEGRSSRRIRGENPSLLDGPLESAAMRKLAQGGRGGRCGGDRSNWNLDGTEIPKQSAEEEGEKKEERYRLVDLKKLENAV